MNVDHDQESLRELGDWLKQHLWDRDLSLTRLEALTGLDKALLSRILNARQKPSPDSLQKLAAALKIGTDELFFLETLAGRIPSNTPVATRYGMTRTARMGFKQSRGQRGPILYNPEWRDFKRLRGNQLIAETVRQQYLEQISPKPMPPVPIEAIADRLLGLSVNVDDLSSVGEVNGGVMYPPTREIIVDKGVRTEGRFRFIVAHECAHWLIHTPHAPSAVQDACIFGSGKRTRQEREADALAAELLVPTDLICSSIREWPSIGPCELAKLTSDYQVSQTAMKVRLEELARFGVIHVDLGSMAQGKGP